MSEHVKPSREEVAVALNREVVRQSAAGLVYISADDGIEFERALADAVLALLPGRTEAEVKAEALREAARAVENDETNGSPSVRELVGSIDRVLKVEAWLSARAERVERGAS
jgi:predicted transcriptional regulator